MECYQDRAIYGVDIDLERARTAASRLDHPLIIVADYEEGWPFEGYGVEDEFAVCDADAYGYPYGAIRAFLRNVRLAETVLSIFRHRWDPAIHRPDDSDL